jgi:hypothetical protein
VKPFYRTLSWSIYKPSGANEKASLRHGNAQARRPSCALWVISGPPLHSRYTFPKPSSLILGDRVYKRGDARSPPHRVPSKWHRANTLNSKCMPQRRSPPGLMVFKALAVCSQWASACVSPGERTNCASETQLHYNSSGSHSLP